MLDVLLDSLLDTLKIIPYLLLTFIILEFIEHKLSNKNKKILGTNKKVGPLFGSILGALPQCGFSVAASNLYSSGIITIGTLIAIFLSTSDEMLPIMLSENIDILLVLKIIGFKVLIGLIIGYIIDLVYKKKKNNNIEHIGEMCEKDHCDCHNHSIIYSSISHTLKISFFILFANVIIGLLIYKVGEDNISNLLLNKDIFTYFISSLIGLIPNCASSVVMTELYLSNLITIGNLLSGLLTGSGLGILLLFKSNKNIKENLLILSIIYFIGVLVGFIVDVII